MSDLNRVETAYRRIGSRWAWNVVSFAGFQGWESSLRRRTVEHLELSHGDRVLDVACGRGSNFPHLQRAVGAEGHIVGVDYSAKMLAGAQELIRRERWTNVEIVRGDAAETEFSAAFDGALCTVAMTVIPRWQDAMRRMIGAVQPGRRIAIMDGRLPTGLARAGLPFARFFSRIVAADLDRDVQSECKKMLNNIREEVRMFGTYFIISGEGPSGV